MIEQDLHALIEPQERILGSVSDNRLSPAIENVIEQLVDMTYPSILEMGEVEELPPNQLLVNMVRLSTDVIVTPSVDYSLSTNRKIRTDGYDMRLLLSDEDGVALDTSLEIHLTDTPDREGFDIDDENYLQRASVFFHHAPFIPADERDYEANYTPSRDRERWQLFGGNDIAEIESVMEVINDALIAARIVGEPMISDEIRREQERAEKLQGIADDDSDDPEQTGVEQFV